MTSAQQKRLIGIGAGTVVTVIVLVALFSAGGLERAIVGKWRGIQGPDVFEIVEFFKDGTISAANKKIGMSMGGEYKFIDKDHLKIIVDSTIIVFKVSILKNELTLVAVDETVYKYRKVK